ncbi:hypothetical protein FNV43_RR11503 [Rhamnella rubrinervis]|uniref:Zinc finger-homeodomain protein 1 n=1 Tax=Rhamnella rubrinervis TaxID=2594499 RepID=A0A8K0H693_9ROSA|nr:hypothetical protein FNV43_RR11503 [Rhamnella rubrinervis]
MRTKYGHLTKEKRVGIHNGSSTTAPIGCTTQTLDLPHHIQQHQSLPDPDRVSGAGALSGTIIGGGPKLKTPSTANIRYRECLKNHAANIGGNVFDGCGEFMPCGEEGTLEALKCAACDCHRNFHRKEIDGESQYSPGSRRSSLMLSPLQLPPPLPSPTSALHHHHHHQKFPMGFHNNNVPTAPIIQPMNVAYGSGGGGGTESSSEDLNVFHSSVEAHHLPAQPFSLSKKRHRTKFTQEQKERMLEFAEKMGWRIQKQDEDEVERFCAEVGVKRQVLKVWMHNNKSTIKKQQENSNNVQSLEVIEAEAEADPELDGREGGMDS